MTTAHQTRTQTSLLTWDKKTAFGEHPPAIPELVTHDLQSHFKASVCLQLVAKDTFAALKDVRKSFCLVEKFSY